MKPVIVDKEAGITLIAGGPVRAAELKMALKRAPRLVAVDGGADQALRLGMQPEAVIGDLDSVSQAARHRLGQDAFHSVTEQESTDFDKALRAVSARFVIAVGATGGRTDHALAVLSGLMRHQTAGGCPCLLLGPQDVIFAAPPEMNLTLRPGDRLSLFPLSETTGESTGLRWPISGLQFSPTGRIGTSNAVTGAQVNLRFDRPGMLVIVARARLDAVIAALI